MRDHEWMGQMPDVVWMGAAMHHGDPVHGSAHPHRHNPHHPPHGPGDPYDLHELHGPVPGAPLGPHAGPPVVPPFVGPAGPPPNAPYIQPPPPPPPPLPPMPPPGSGAYGPFAPRVRRGDVRAAVLSLLSEEPRNGYQIIQEIAERSAGIWRPSPGSVYPALQQLEDEGLVLAEESAGRRIYRLTDEGRAYVAERADELAAPWSEVANSLPEEMAELRLVWAQVNQVFGQLTQVANARQVAAANRLLRDTRRSIFRILAEDDLEDTDDD